MTAVHLAVEALLLVMVVIRSRSIAALERVIRADRAALAVACAERDELVKQVDRLLDDPRTAPREDYGDDD